MRTISIAFMLIFLTSCSGHDTKLTLPNENFKYSSSLRPHTFSSIDSNNDQQITSNEIESAGISHFQELDTNGDHFLSSNEWNVGTHNTQILLTDYLHHLDSLKEQSDENKDGTISEKEFHILNKHFGAGE